MITIILMLQLSQSLLVGHIIVFSQSFYVIYEMSQQLFLADTANITILIQHTDIGNVVQLAEDAQLAKLRYSRQEHKT